jgi:hypothetical protein
MRETVLRLYGHVVRDEPIMMIEEFMRKLGTSRGFPYAVSSVECNMFRLSWAARAIGAGLFDKHWESGIEPAVDVRLAKTPYTNYTGDWEMAEKTKQENQQDFKAIIDAGGSRGKLAETVVEVMARYIGVCAEANAVQDTIAPLEKSDAPFAKNLLKERKQVLEAKQSHAEELDALTGRLYALVRDWEEVPV